MNELRSEKLGIRLTPSERRRLLTLARSSGMSVTGVVSTLIKQADGILGPRVVVRHTTEQRGEYVTPHGG